MRSFILALSLVGTLLFGAAFAVSFVSPLTIERAAREVLRVQVEKRVGGQIDALSDPRVVELARKALGKTDAEFEATQRSIRDEVPKRVANRVADFMNADCECRKRLVVKAENQAQNKLLSLSGLRERLGSLIETTYASLRDKLLREWRIFTGVNTAAFVLLGGLALARPATTRQLMLPAVVLVLAGVVTAAFYVLQQDWLRTIVFGDYLGFAYAAYFGVALAFFGDIVMNKAKLTTSIVSSLGGGPSPC